MVKNEKRMEMYIRQNNWKKARHLILHELEKEPEDHWLLTRLSTTYYEDHKYNEALKISKKAFNIASKCPLVLWDYAGALDMTGQHKEAIAIWKKLIKLDIHRVAYEKCGEGLRWAQSLINDCRYRIGNSYRKMGMLRQAMIYLQVHLDNRKPGVPSIYLLTDVKKEMKSINQQMNMV